MNQSNRVAAKLNRAVVETIERRLMLDAVLMTDGTLVVSGTNAADAIAVNFDTAIGTTVNGVTQSFAAADVKGLKVVALEGADTVNVTGHLDSYTYSQQHLFPVDLDVGGGTNTVSVDVTPLSSFDSSTLLTVEAGDDADTISVLSTGPATLHGGGGDDHISVSVSPSYTDLQPVLYGDGGNDTLAAMGDDITAATMYGGDGDDLFQNQSDNCVASVSGGAGTDTVDVWNGYGMTTAIALDGQVTPGSNFIADTDVENVTGGYDFTMGAFTVTGNDSANRITLTAREGSVYKVYGLGGNDYIAIEGTDRATSSLVGGDGDDTLVGGYGADHFSGGTGNDTVDYSGRSAGVVVYLDGSQTSGDPTIGNYDGVTGQATTGEGDTFDGTVDAVYGTAFGDRIVGTRYANAVFGNGGNDTLVGNGGTDAFFGGDGDDELIATGGTEDYLDGGAGFDTAYTGTGDTVVNVESVNPAQLAGTAFGTAGSYKNTGDTIAKAFDGNTATYFDGPAADGNVVGLDFGSAKTIGSIAVTPRAGYEFRMKGGYFQASNSSSFTTAVTLYTIRSTPATGTTIVTVAAGAFRDVRYVSPAGSYGNVAELVFYAPTTSKFSGTVIGTPGSYKNSGDTAAKAFDGSVTTFFDGPDASGDWVGLDLGSAKVVTQVRFAPRPGLEFRMKGGVIQASNSATFSTGVVTLATITTTPPSGTLTTVTFAAPVARRYYRYLGPAGAYCNIAELEFDG